MLGTIGALLIVWLTALGIRKALYNANGTVQGLDLGACLSGALHVWLWARCIVLSIRFQCTPGMGADAVVIVSGFLWPLRLICGYRLCWPFSGVI